MGIDINSRNLLSQRSAKLLAGHVLAYLALLPTLAISAADKLELKASIEKLSIDMSAHGANFPELQLVLDDESVTQPFQLVTLGTDAKDQQARVLAAYTLQQHDADQPGTRWQQTFAQPLHKSVTTLQTVATANGAALLNYAGDTVGLFDPVATKFVSQLEVPSIYRADAVEFDADVTIARDLTGDGLDDLLMPDFAGWRFAVALAAGGFSEPQLFGPKPLMNVGSARYVNFTAHTPYVFDHNQDGLQDVAFWNDGALEVYQQFVQADASPAFSTEPVRLTVAPNIESDAFFSLSIGTDEDNPTGRQVLLDAIEDLDGDGLPELVVYSVTGEGLFGKETRYEIHRGELDAQNLLSFEAQPSSVIGSGGVQINVERQDLDGDGTLEMLVTSFDLGIGSIIRGLLSRTANLQLAIYAMRDGRYLEDPVLTRKVTAKLDIANGDIFVPAVLAGDVDGDGLKDLLVQDGDDKLKVFIGQTGKRPFARSPLLIDMELPEGAGSVRVVNLDGDAIDDLLLVFDADKSAKQQPRVHAVRFLANNSPR